MDVVAREPAHHATVNTVCALACTCKSMGELMNSNEVLHVLYERFDLKTSSFSEFVRKYDMSILDDERESNVSLNECVRSAIADDSVIRMKIMYEMMSPGVEDYGVILTYTARMRSLRVFKYLLPLAVEIFSELVECSDDDDVFFTLCDVSREIMSHMEIDTISWFFDTVFSDEELVALWDGGECMGIRDAVEDVLCKIYVQCVSGGDMTRYNELVECHPLLKHDISDTKSVIVCGVVNSDPLIACMIFGMRLLTVNDVEEYVESNDHYNSNTVSYIQGHISYSKAMEWSKASMKRILEQLLELDL